MLRGRIKGTRGSILQIHLLGGTIYIILTCGCMYHPVATPYINC